MIMLFMRKRDLFVAPNKIKYTAVVLVLVVLRIIQQVELQEPEFELSG